MARGDLEEGSGEYAAAITDLSKCLVIDPAIANCHFYRGRAYLNLDEWDHAKADFVSYLVVFSDDGDALYDKALAEKHLGDTKSAIADATAALKRYKIDGKPSDAADAQTLLDSLHG
jgi:tetratricopeptide (TPR) repeat protein